MSVMPSTDSGRRYAGEPGGKPEIIKTHDERIFDLERYCAWQTRQLIRVERRLLGALGRIEAAELMVGALNRPPEPQEPSEPEPPIGPGAHQVDRT